MRPVAPNSEIALSIAKVLEDFNHPFAIVGRHAHRWMGGNGMPDSAIDLLLRDEQIVAISSRLLLGGKWFHVEPEKETEPNEEEAATYDFIAEQRRDFLFVADILLEYDRTSKEREFFVYLRLWSEASYKMKVDEGKWLAVPAIMTGCNILAEKCYDPALDRGDRWWCCPRLLGSPEDTAAQIGTLDGGRILIPSIPSYLDALVRQATQYESTKPMLAILAQWQIRNLTRYLYLEQPRRSTTILFEVDADSEEYLENYFLNYKRKPRFVRKGRILLQVEDTQVMAKGQVTSDHQIVPYPGL